MSAASRPRPSPGTRGWGLRIGLAGGWVTLAAAVGYVLAFNPTDRRPDPAGPCAWHSLFAINGPSCGGARMLWYLLHGDLVQAARHHLVALVGAPFALYALVQFSTAVWFRWRLPPLRLSARVYAAYAVGWLLYAAVLRNLPWQPFAWFDIPDLT